MVTGIDTVTILGAKTRKLTIAVTPLIIGMKMNVEHLIRINFFDISLNFFRRIEVFFSAFQFILTKVCHNLPRVCGKTAFREFGHRLSIGRIITSRDRAELS